MIPCPPIHGYLHILSPSAILLARIKQCLGQSHKVLVAKSISSRRWNGKEGGIFQAKRREACGLAEIIVGGAGGQLDWCVCGGLPGEW